MERVRRFGWVALATVLGAGVAVWATRQGQPAFAFLSDAERIVVERPTSESNGYVTYRRAYLVPRSAEQVHERIRREFGVTISQNPDVVVVPRVEGGRVRATYPPERTILVAPAKKGSGTIVEMIEYSRPSPLDGLLSKVRRGLGI